MIGLEPRAANFLISLAVGIGAVYALRPAPPFVALAGLLGIVIGEQGVSMWLRH